MPLILDTEAFLDTVCELLRQGQTDVAIPVAGGSMVPFLHHGDTVCLNLLDSAPKRGDVVLYRRESGRYILHRIYRMRRDGSVLMVGDAQQEIEILPSRDMICARVTSARHQGKLCQPGQLRWWFYRRVWLRLRPVRYFLMSLRGWKKK